MDEIVRESMLFDCYGSLLTEKKRKVMELYYSEDLSLSEIAEAEQVTRSAVHDSLRSARRKLEEYESRLHLLEKELRVREMADRLDGVIRKMGSGPEDRETAKELRAVREMIEEAYGI